MLPMDQKAPSAIRCIKTSQRDGQQEDEEQVRKHRAPKGALRPLRTIQLSK